MTGSDSATRHKRLSAGRPVWLSNRRRPRVPHGPLNTRFEPDVLVIGSGISGALIADALVTAGKRVVVLDRRPPLQGSTAASTALLQFELDIPLSKIAPRIGRARAMRAWWRSVQGVDHLRSRIVDLAIDCDFRERCSVYLPGDVLDLGGLEREAALRQQAGLRSAMIDRKQLRRLTGIDRAGALLSQGAAEADPLKLAAGLWRANAARGVKLYTPAQVDDVLSFSDHVRVKTDTGQALHAGAAVFATGYELAKFIRPKGYRVSSTWAYATRIQKAALWQSRCLIWEAADPYLYVRSDAAGRVIVGGEDEDFSDEETRDRILPEKIAAIQRKLERLMPRIDAAPVHAWCGSFGASTTSLPLIGAIPRHRHCYAVLGFGGNGFTFSAIAAQILQRTLCGVKDPDADLFALA
jgi:glycine/D-amino acid oxidase-like deaminating enzyme